MRPSRGGGGDAKACRCHSPEVWQSCFPLGRNWGIRKMLWRPAGQLPNGEGWHLKFRGASEEICLDRSAFGCLPSGLCQAGF